MYLLTRISGARRVLEIGTLGGTRGLGTHALPTSWTLNDAMEALELHPALAQKFITARERFGTAVDMPGLRIPANRCNSSISGLVSIEQSFERGGL